MLYPEESKKLDFLAHLEELRKRIIYSLAVFALSAIVLFSLSERLMRLVTAPIRGLTGKMIFISPTEAFTAYLTAALLASLVVTFPFILYQVWAFIAPAVPKKKRPHIVVWLLFSLILFLGGFAFSYFLAIPGALTFLMNFGREVASPQITLGRYVSFFGALELAGGIVFQIPIAIALLADTGIVSAQAFRRKRPHAIVAIMIFAAVITPTQDIVNMLIFALPMMLLFEVGLLVATYIEKGRARP